jgi:hypothetical protein
MRFANSNKFDRKSGVAQWRDPLFLFRFSHRIVILSGAPYRFIA